MHTCAYDRFARHCSKYRTAAMPGKLISFEHWATLIYLTSHNNDSLFKKTSAILRTDNRSMCCTIRVLINYEMAKSWRIIVAYCHIDPLRTSQNGGYFADDVFKCIMLHQTVMYFTSNFTHICCHGSN